MDISSDYSDEKRVIYADSVDMDTYESFCVITSTIPSERKTVLTVDDVLGETFDDEEIDDEEDDEVVEDKNIIRDMTYYHNNAFYGDKYVRDIRNSDDSHSDLRDDDLPREDMLSVVCYQKFARRSVVNSPIVIPKFDFPKNLAEFTYIGLNRAVASFNFENLNNLVKLELKTKESSIDLVDIYPPCLEILITNSLLRKTQNLPTSLKRLTCYLLNTNAKMDDVEIMEMETEDLKKPHDLRYLTSLEYGEFLNIPAVIFPENIVELKLPTLLSDYAQKENSVVITQHLPNLVRFTGYGIRNCPMLEYYDGYEFPEFEHSLKEIYTDTFSLIDGVMRFYNPRYTRMEDDKARKFFKDMKKYGFCDDKYDLVENITKTILSAINTNQVHTMDFSDGIYSFGGLSSYLSKEFVSKDVPVERRPKKIICYFGFLGKVNLYEGLESFFGRNYKINSYTHTLKHATCKEIRFDHQNLLKTLILTGVVSVIIDDQLPVTDKFECVCKSHLIPYMIGKVSGVLEYEIIDSDYDDGFIYNKKGAFKII